jgi:hypothetical protein
MQKPGLEKQGPGLEYRYQGWKNRDQGWNSKTFSGIETRAGIQRPGLEQRLGLEYKDQGWNRDQSRKTGIKT